MPKKYQILLLIVTLLAASVSLSYAYPKGNEEIWMHLFWQRDYGDVLGCRYNDTACRTQRSDATISQKGCALTSAAMLYYAYGYWTIPDENHDPLPVKWSFENKLDPYSLNQYLSQKDQFGRLLGFRDDNYDFDWLKTTSNFYYYDDTPGAYGTGLHYAYMVPNYDCTPIAIGQQRRDGSVRMLSRSASCFRTDWSEGAISRLDYDLSWGGNYAPAIMKIKYTKNNITKTHFVIIGGYGTSCGNDEDACYRAHNPASRDNWDTIPKSLDSQYGDRFTGMDTLYRFIGKYSSNPLTRAGLIWVFILRWKFRSLTLMGT